MNQRLIIHYLLQKLEEKNRRIKELEEYVEELEFDLKYANNEISELEATVDDLNGREFTRMCAELNREYEAELI